MTALLDPWFKMNVGDGAFYALFGLLFVVVGIALLVLILMLIGFIMRKISERKQEEKAPAPPPDRRGEVPSPAEDGGDEVSPEVIAAITAALMGYYQTENAKCDFVVRRVKRL